MVLLRPSSRAGKEERAKLRKAAPSQPGSQQTPQLPTVLPNVASLTLNDPSLRPAAGKQSKNPRSEWRHESDSPEVLTPKPKAIHIGPAKDPYCEAVAQRNTSRDDDHSVGDLQDDTRRGGDALPGETYGRDVLANEKRGKEDFCQDKSVKQHKIRPMKRQPAVGDDRVRAEREMVLGRSEDTETYRSQAAPVTHETRIVDTHEIITKPITREIHNHHIIHRVQPIQDIEVLPPRHFVALAPDRRPVEIAPPPSSTQIQEYIQQAFASQAEQSRIQQRQKYKADIDNRGDRHREWISSGGIHCSESVWYHKPQLDTAAKDAGETMPFHLGQVDPMEHKS